MIRINLLPHREYKRARRRLQYWTFFGIAAVVGVLIVALVHIAIVQQIDNQKRRNDYLKKEIVALDKQLEEIKKLKEQIQALQARKKVVETLRTGRAEVVRLMDQLVRELPEGVYLRAVKQNGARVNIIGFAQSNARVSTLMRNLDASPWLESPVLVEIKAVQVGKSRTNEFNLNVNLTRQTEEPVKEPAKGQPPAKKAATQQNEKAANAAGSPGMQEKQNVAMTQYLPTHRSHHALAEKSRATARDSQTPVRFGERG